MWYTAAQHNQQTQSLRSSILFLRRRALPVTKGRLSLSGNQGIFLFSALQIRRSSRQTYHFKEVQEEELSLLLKGRI